MTEPLSPETLAWLRQTAKFEGAVTAQVLLHLLERVEVLEAAQQQPHQDKLDRLIALDRGDDEPTPEAAPVATDEELCSAYNNAPGHSFGPAIRAVYNLGRQHGAALAQPEGEGPSLAEVDELCAEFGFHLDDDQGEGLEILQEMIGAALQRWGRPTAPPAPLADLAATLIAESKPLDREIALTPEGRWGLYEGLAAPPAPEVGGRGGGAE